MLLALVAAPVVGIAGFLAWPIPPSLLAPPTRPGITVTDRTGALLRTTRASDGQRHRWLPLDAIDPLIPAAFIAIEDRGFATHHGVAWGALLRATRDNLAAGRVVSGASTITMQLARLLSGASRSPIGKARQLLWALRLDAHLDKRTILEQYLNRVPLGQGTVGVDAAARYYAGTSAAQLSPGTAALLAALARAPTRDNPATNPARADRTRRRVLEQLVRAGVLSREGATLAADEPLLARANATQQPLAPHFIARVLGWLDSTDAEGEIRTTLDLALQRDIEGEVREAVRQLADKGARDAAVVVLDNATGDVLSWVGSPDFWRTAPAADGRAQREGGQVDMVVGRRQPGSALKPFVYALAFDQGDSPATVLADLPRTFPTATGNYAPRNYDRRYHGPVRAREALASSYNVPAVLLADRVGVPAVHRTLRAAGFASLSRAPEFYGLGLSLGNGEVTLVELANGYRALANAGVWHPWRWQAGALPDTTSTRVVTPLAAAQVLDILADPSARLAGFGEQTPFDFPFPVAVKTGTSRHFTDNWAVATTGTFTVAVWVGNFDGTPMQAVSGISGAGPLLRRVVWRTAADRAPGLLASPATAGAQRVRVCRLSGGLATADCPGVDEWMGSAQRTALHDCRWHRGGGGVVWPTEYRGWAERMGREVRVADTHRADGTGRLAATPAPALLALESPRDGDRFELPIGDGARYATIPLRAVTPGGAVVRWFVDGQPHPASRWRLSPGAHVIRAESEAGTVEARVTVERVGG
jgi:penicillin-binding protein 1C